MRRGLAFLVVENGVLSRVLSHMYLGELETSDRMNLRIDWFRCISDGKAARDLHLLRRDEGPGDYFDMGLIGGQALGKVQAADQHADDG